MELRSKEVSDWPKLTWVATCSEGSREIQVFHGPCVETHPEWCVEAVWAGTFKNGDFDLTDLVFGTGIRIRQEQVVFVSSGTTLDRLWYCRDASVWNVSNSLPALLAFGRNRLLESYQRYPQDLCSVVKGLGQYVRELPLEHGVARDCPEFRVWNGLTSCSVLSPLDIEEACGRCGKPRSLRFSKERWARSVRPRLWQRPCALCILRRCW
jgi:hypothetical protein